LFHQKRQTSFTVVQHDFSGIHQYSPNNHFKTFVLCVIKKLCNHILFKNKIQYVMKKLSISAFAFAATLSISSLLANNISNNYNLAGTPVSITSKSKSVVVDFENPQNEILTVNIAHEDGRTLIQENITTSKRYNVSKFERGNYTLTLTKKDAKTIQPFQITEGGVVMKEKEEKVLFAPAIIRRDDVMQVNALANQYTNITVSIQDALGRTVYEDKNYVVFNLQKAYSVSTFPRGDYRLVVQVGDKTYSHMFSK
jgi:hypothetical protein